MSLLGNRPSIFLYSLVAFSLQLLLLKTFEYLYLFANVIEILPMGLLGLSIGTILAAASRDPQTWPKRESQALSALIVLMILIVPAILQIASATLVVLSVLAFVALGYLIALNLLGGQFAHGYVYDILGSITGLILVWALLPRLGGERFYFICLLAISFWAWRKKAKIPAALGGFSLAIVAALALAGTPPDLIWWVKRPTEEAGPNSSRLMVRQPGSELLATRWSLLDRIDAIRYEGVTTLYYNDRPWTNLPSPNPDRFFHPKGAKSALIIGVGGGRDIAELADAGVTRIVGSEISPEVVALMRGPLYNLSSGIYDQAEVQGVNGRTLMRNSRENFDIILSIFPDLVRGGRTSHIFMENYLWTEESFADYLRLLSPRGQFILGWSIRDNSLGSARRFLGTLRRGFELAGIPIKDHGVVYLRKRDSGHYHLHLVLKKTPFTIEEISHLKNFHQGLTPVVLPNSAFPAPPDFLPLEQKSYFKNVQQLFGGQTADWNQDRDFSNPATDNHPFIYYTAERALFSSFTMNCMIGVLLFFLLAYAFWGRNLVPLGHAPASAQLHCFFSGAFFCLIETYLIRRLNFYFGNPVQNMTFVLAAMLIGAALPAALAAREKAWSGVRKVVLLAPLAALAFYCLLPSLTELLPPALAYPFAILLIVPIGIFSSFIFPYFCRSEPSSTGLLYGLNLLGFFGASALSISFGILLGNRAVFFTALGIAALQAAYFWWELRPKPAV